MGVVALLTVYLVVFLLSLVVPGRWVQGYVRERYHLNGLRVFIVVVAAWVALCSYRVLPWDFFFVHRWEMLATATVVGLVFTLAIVLPAPPTGKGLLADLYLGRLENPQRGRVDAKMFLYLVGAVMLALNVSSFAAHQPKPGVILYAALFLFFLTEYLFFERVHLYTYDFVAERVGFKLGWGCLVFYPFFYCIALWGPAADMPLPVLIGAAAMFFCGWMLARGANMQKYYFKTQPGRARFGPLQQRALGDSVLVSGFWGISRHVNYLGEILMASGLALSVGNAIGWLYPLYYLVLLVPRQIDDDKRCAQKYGPLWEEYKREVPYRIVPWVY